MSTTTLERHHAPRSRNIKDVRVGEPETPHKQESIFEYYSVENEIDFLNKIDRTAVPRDRAEHYVEENVFRFLGEFAGNVPYTTIAFHQDGDAPLTFAGINLTNSYRRTARNGGEREFDEYVGFQKIQGGFAEGGNTATWISPPKMADYGFVFHFSRDPVDPKRIREYILRYDEKRGQIQNSQAILDRIDPSQTHETDRGFLQNPHVGVSPQNPQDDLAYVMRSVGIDESKVHKSVRFETRIRKELAPWVQQYIREVFDGNVDRAKLILTALYNKATEIAESIDRLTELNISLHTPLIDEDEFLSSEALMFYGSKKATVTGGGSCPVTRNDKRNPFDPNSVVDDLIAGKSINKILEENEPFVCPSCDKKSPNPLPRTDDSKHEPYCPHCKITMSEAEEKGFTVC